MRGTFRRLLAALPKAGIVGFATAAAQGDVVFDGTLGAGGGLTGPEFAVTADRGRQLGPNLFHSFQTFDLAQGERATFSGPASVTRVFARVTGGAGSTIDGTLRSTIPGASLVFINPAGVTFGPNATLDVSGSFFVATADSVRFADGARFSAVEAGGASDVLSTAAPAAFGFAGPQPAPIISAGANLQVGPGQAVGIIGGGVGIVGGRVVAPGGISVLAPKSAGEVKLTSGGFDLSEFGGFGNVVITESAVLNANGGAGGGLMIAGFDVSVASSTLSADATAGADGSRTARVIAAGALNLSDVLLSADALVPVPAGSVELTAAGDVTISNGSFVSADALNDGAVGDVRVRAGEALKLMDTSTLRLAAFGSATGGLLDVEAGSVLVDGTAAAGTGESPADLSTTSNGSGRGADIRLRAGSLTVRQGLLVAANAGAGAGGNLDIEAATIDVDGVGAVSSVLGTQTVAPATGTGGNAVIRAATVTAHDGGVISTSTSSAGRGGSLTVSADRVTAGPRGAAIVAGFAVETAAAGAGGTLTINAGSVDVVSGGLVTAANDAAGAGGRVVVNARTVTADGSLDPAGTGFSAEVRSTATGPGGSVEINVTDGGTLQFRNLAGASTRTFGSGAGGNVTVRGPGARVVLSDAGVVLAETFGAAPGGSVTLDVGRLNVMRDSVISTAARAAGDAGAIRVTAGEVNIDGTGALSSPGAGLAAETVAGSTGRGGTIELNVAGALRVANGGAISSSTAAAGEARGVNVKAGSVLVEAGGIAANVLPGATGRGGTVNVTTPGELRITKGGLVQAVTAGSGNAGGVTVDAGSIVVDGVEGVGGISGEVLAGATGRGGTLEVAVSGEIQLLNGGQISSTTDSPGTGGDVTVRAGTLTINGGGRRDRQAGVAANSLGRTPDAGDGGNVTVNATGTLTIADGGFIAAATSGSGNGGIVSVAANDVILDGGSVGANISAQTAPAGIDPALAGDAGRIEVRAAGTLIINGGRPELVMPGDTPAETGIASRTLAGGAGNAGRIDLSAARVLIDGRGGAGRTGIAAGSEGGATGNGGMIVVGTAAEPVQELVVINGGEISSVTQGAGAGGPLTIAAGTVALSGPGSTLSAQSTGAGTGGRVEILAGGDVLLDNGASILASCTSTGDAGGIAITAGRDVRLAGGASIATAADLANAGRIDVDAGRAIDLSDNRPGVPRPSDAVNRNAPLGNTRITAEAVRGGQGNIALRAPRSVSLSHSLVTAQSFDAAGARIAIDPEFVILNDSVINGRITNPAAVQDVPVTIVADTFLRSADSLVLSNVATVPVEVDIAGSLTRLPGGLADAAAELQALCGANLSGDVSSFVITGRGGAAPEPGGWASDVRLAESERGR